MDDRSENYAPPFNRRPRLPQRRRSDVLSATAAIPAGFVSTYEAIAASVGLSAVKVASILADLDPDEADRFPWHRIVHMDGRLSTQCPLRCAAQREKLAREGVTCDDAGRLDDVLAHLTTILLVTRVRLEPDAPADNENQTPPTTTAET